MLGRGTFDWKGYVMRTLLVLLGALAVVSSGSIVYAQTQDPVPEPYRIIELAPGPIVLHDRELIAPAHDPAVERVAFRVSPVYLDQSDIPFFVGREGRVVSRQYARHDVYDWLVAGDVALVCDLPAEGGEVPSLNYRGTWTDRCDIERLERDSP